MYYHAEFGRSRSQDMDVCKEVPENLAVLARLYGMGCR